MKGECIVKSSSPKIIDGGLLRPGESPTRTVQFAEKREFLSLPLQSYEVGGTFVRLEGPENTSSAAASRSRVTRKH